MGHRTHAAHLLFVLVFSTAVLTAHAAVYRCGAIYQDTPCTGGSTIQAEDPRSAQQQFEAARAVQNDAAMAEAARQKELKPRKVITRKTPLPKASGAQGR